jgi:hypothetical protein
MVRLLEALYLLTTIAAVVTLAMMWRERPSRRAALARRSAPRWAGITVVLAVVCVALYLYVGPR